MIPQFAYGFDYGNAETCGYLIEHGMRRSKVLPSATSPGSLTNLATKRSAMGDNYERECDALRDGECVLSLNGSELYVGNLALAESRDATTGRGDVNRYWSAKSLALLLTVSGEMISSPDYELYVVTGLPIETFTKENREKVRVSLEGDHHFLLNGRKRHAVIHIVRVVMEGAGAMIAYGKNEDILQGVIDIGGRTTDLYVAQGQRPVAEMCRGKALGVESIADVLCTQFNTTYGRPLTAHETRQIIRAWGGSEPIRYPVLQAYGVRAESAVLHDWTEEAINHAAQDILSFISTAWNSSERGAVAADIAPVLMIGGGAYYFAKLIKRRIPHIIVPMRPETSNAEGYTTLADVLMSRLRAVA